MEYAVLIVVVIAALLVMQIYLKRGVSGRLRSTTDSIGQPYAPGQTTSSLTTTTFSDSTTQSKLQQDQDLGGGLLGDVMLTTVISSEHIYRTGSEEVDALGTDLWK